MHCTICKSYSVAKLCKHPHFLILLRTQRDDFVAGAVQGSSESSGSSVFVENRCRIQTPMSSRQKGQVVAPRCASRVQQMVQAQWVHRVLMLEFIGLSIGRLYQPRE